MLSFTQYDVGVGETRAGPTPVTCYLPGPGHAECTEVPFPHH